MSKASGSSGKLYWTGIGNDALSETNLAGAVQTEYIFFNGKRSARVDYTTAGAITLVQHATHDNGSTSASTVVVTLNGVSGGDLLTCSASFGNNPTLSLADNVNGSWSVANAVHYDSANTQTTAQFYRANSAAGNITVTLTASTSQQWGALNCQEWRNAATSSPLDKNTQQDGTTANPSSGSITTTANGELILGGLENVQSPTAGTGFSQIDSTPTTWLSTEYQIQSNAGSVAATWTAPATNWTAQVASFKQATGSTSNIYFYMEDMLGTSRVLTTSTGSICYDADFYPYGVEIVYTTTCTQNTYKFTGQERDSESALDNFGRGASWRAGDRPRIRPG